MLISSEGMQELRRERALRMALRSRVEDAEPKWLPSVGERFPVALTREERDSLLDLLPRKD